MSWDHQVWWVHIFSITNTHNDIFMDIHIFYPSSVLLMWSSCKFWSSLYLHVSELYFLITWTPYTSIHGLTLVSVNDWSHCKCSLKADHSGGHAACLCLYFLCTSYVHQSCYRLLTVYFSVLTSTITEDMLLMTFTPDPNFHWKFLTFTFNLDQNLSPCIEMSWAWWLFFTSNLSKFLLTNV